MSFSSFVEVLFASGLFLNALLFLPQAYQLHRRRHAHGVSLLTFLGFNFMQAVTILHALQVHDTLLFLGFWLSFITCGGVTLLIVYYRKASEQVSFEQEHVYQTLLQYFPGHVYYKNTDGIYVGCNEQQAQSLGLSSHHVILGKTDDDLPWDQADAKRMRENDAQVMQSGEPVIVEETALFNGIPSPVLSQKIPLRNQSNHVVGLLGLSIDIRARKEAEALLHAAKEEAERSNQAKSDFIAVASHEFRTPLTCISGLVTFLQRDTLSPKERDDYLDELKGSTDYLLRLVNTVLDFTKLEAGGWDLQVETLNLKSLVQTTLSRVGPIAEAKGLMLQMDYPDSVPTQVFSDARTLQHVLMNLLQNALQFTERGHVSVRVNYDANTAHFSIAVEDTGIGIPEAQQALIFERFQQVASPYRRATSQAGTGLGLTLVKKWVETLQGSITVQSQLHRGSTFTCGLPLACVSEGKASSPAWTKAMEVSR